MNRPPNAQPAPARGFHLMTKPIGPLCNLDCMYCFYLEKKKLFPANENFRMTGAVLETYVRQYIEAQEVPEITFAWQGGEPTLMGVDFFRTVIALQTRYASGKRIINTLQTNGTLLDDDWCAFLKEHGFLVGLSIDGPRDLHDAYRVDKRQRPTFGAVMHGLNLLQKHGVEFNTLTVVNRLNSQHPLQLYRFLKEIGSRYLQFIPLVERKADSQAQALGLSLAAPPTPHPARGHPLPSSDEGRGQGENSPNTHFAPCPREPERRLQAEVGGLGASCGLPPEGGVPPAVHREGNQARGQDAAVAPLSAKQTPVTEWSVESRQYGEFLVQIFEEWVTHDVGEVFVQLFDVALGNWMGLGSDLCVFAEKCGGAMALEHNGDLYSCDHYVYPDYKLGNLLNQSLGDMVRSGQQRKFGSDKLDTLPRYCRECEVRFACHGECPKHRFIHTPDGEPGLNYLCAGYKHFFTHIDPYMQALAQLLKSGRGAAEIMDLIAEHERSEVWQTVGRNDPCPCGSGKKYKQCCESRRRMVQSRQPSRSP